MKLSVSLPAIDVEFLDTYAHERGDLTRSAVLQRAVRLLRASELQDDYLDAWDEWYSCDDADLWDTVATAGIGSR